MSAKERIAAAVEFVRSGHGGYAKAAQHFRMTMDVVKKACATAGVADRVPQKLPGPTASHARNKFNRDCIIPKGAHDDRLRAEMEEKRRGKRATRASHFRNNRQYEQ